MWYIWEYMQEYGNLDANGKMTTPIEAVVRAARAFWIGNPYAKNPFIGWQDSWMDLAMDLQNMDKCAHYFAGHVTRDEIMDRLLHEELEDSAWVQKFLEEISDDEFEYVQTPHVKGFIYCKRENDL